MDQALVAPNPPRTPIYKLDVAIHFIHNHVFPHLGLKELFTLASINDRTRAWVMQYIIVMKVIDFGQEPWTSQTALETLSHEAKRFHKLNFRLCRKTLHHDIFFRFISNNCQHRTLRVLDLTRCESLNEWSLTSLIGTCPNLTHLSLRGNEWVHAVPVNDLVKSCRKLVHLDLSECRKGKIEKGGIAHITASAPSSLINLLLTKLDLVDSDINAIVQNCPQLQWLNLKDCSRLSLAAFEPLLEQAANLRILQIKGSGPSSDPNWPLVRKIKNRGIKTDLLEFV